MPVSLHFRLKKIETVEEVASFMSKSSLEVLWSLTEYGFLLLRSRRLLHLTDVLWNGLPCTFSIMWLQANLFHAMLLQLQHRKRQTWFSNTPSTKIHETWNISFCCCISELKMRVFTGWEHTKIDYNLIILWLLFRKPWKSPSFASG